MFPPVSVINNAAEMDAVSPSTQDKLFKLSPVRDTATWNRVKTAFRIISIIFAFGAVVESFILLRSSTPFVLPVLPITSSFACIIWNLAVFLLIRIRNTWISKPRAIHIIFETVVWLLGFSSTAVQGISVKNRTDVPDIFWTLIGSLALFSTLHFIIFIRYCVESSRRKKDKRVQELIQNLFKENQRSMGLSTLPPIVSPLSPSSVDYDQLHFDKDGQPVQAAELPSRPPAAELATAREPVELPGDQDYIHAHEIASSR